MSLLFEVLNIQKQRRRPCTRTISDPQCTQSTGPLTGTNLHIMSTLRRSLCIHMPVTESLSLWDSTCLQGTSESWILHIVGMVKTPEVRYLGYTCFPASNSSLPSTEERLVGGQFLSQRTACDSRLILYHLAVFR